MKKKVMSKEKAAQALTLLAEEHLKTYPEDERERMIQAFGTKVSELRRKNAKSSKSRAASSRRRQPIVRR